MVENEFTWLLDALQDLMIELEESVASLFTPIESDGVQAQFILFTPDERGDSIVVIADENGISFLYLNSEAQMQYRGRNLVIGLDLIAEMIVAVWR
jgi:hypothetical protein